MSKLTVAEYAEKHSISKQAVYKRLDSLNTVVEDRNGRRIVLIIDEDEERTPEIQPNSTDFNPISTEIQPDIKPISTEFKPNLNQDIQPNSTTKPENDLNLSVISILQKQLEEKDRQIERLQEETKEKDRQIQEQFDKFTALLMRSQELEALTHKLLSDQTESEEQEENTTIAIDEEKEPQKKRSFWQRLFRK